MQSSSHYTYFMRSAKISLPQAKHVEIMERRTNLCLGCSGVYVGSVSLRHFLELHLEHNSEMVGAFVHKMVAQRAFCHPEYSDHQYLPLWDQNTKPNCRQGSLLSLVLSCKQSFRDFLGEEGRGSRDQDLAAQCWGGKAWSPLCGSEFCTKQLLDRTKVLTELRHGWGRGMVLRSVISVWWT